MEINIFSKEKKEVEPQYIKSPLNNEMLNYRTYIMGREEKILAYSISFVIGGFVGLIFYGNLFMLDGVATTATHISNIIVFIIIGLLATKFLVPIYVKNRLEKRRGILKQQFRDMLESLAASFSSGSNVQMAFESALEDLNMQYGEKDYIVVEMQEVINGMRQNVDISDILRSFGERSGCEDVINFADVFEICYRKGGNMNSVIHRTHNVISDKMAIADEIETKLTSNKLQHNVMSLMPIAVVAMLKGTNEAFAENFATPLGVVVNTVAIGVFVGAYIYGLKIVDIKTNY